MTTSYLRRTINLPLLVFYGIGTILGAGIYVLVGKVAGVAGMQAPFAFLLAAVLAGFTAFSYAELSSRYPKSAGEAIYIQHGFNLQGLSITVGLMIVMMGVASTATLINGVLGYLDDFKKLDHDLVIIVLTLSLGTIVAWGISQSVIIASLMTVIEIFGLVLVLWVAGDRFTSLPARFDELLPSMDAMTWSGLMVGAFIAFYAFIGYEDIVNVAEEVKNPQRNLPLAIILALVITTLFYILVSTVSVLTVPPEQLAKSDKPLSTVYMSAAGDDGRIISAISIFSALNGALIQLVMASRILYGMSQRQWLPTYLGVVNARTRTPVHSTVLVTLAILILALLLPTLKLAKLTSFITLTVFILINLSLWRIKLKDSTRGGIRVPLFVPVTGFLFSACFLLYQLYVVVS
jgi:APA family basic amino acid/polyamine antiporter